MSTNELDRALKDLADLQAFKDAWQELFPGQSASEAEETVRTLKRQNAAMRELLLITPTYPLNDWFKWRDAALATK